MRLVLSSTLVMKIGDEGGFVEFGWGVLAQSGSEWSVCSRVITTLDIQVLKIEASLRVMPRDVEDKALASITVVPGELAEVTQLLPANQGPRA